MGYLHIPNLYRPEAQTILLFKRCYALEKIHGTSAHVAWRGSDVTFFSGGEKHERFVRLFDPLTLLLNITATGLTSVVVYGEAYGGSQQGQSWRYGKDLRFVAFDVKVGDGEAAVWLSVPQAEAFVRGLGLEFVHYVEVSTDLADLNAERDAASVQSRRNGVEGDHPREGIVLRPLVELRTNNGGRVIAKHKPDSERETRSPRAVADPAKLAVLADAQAIADEWATETRLSHVLDKLPSATGPEHTAAVIAAMVEDVEREAKGEIVVSREARSAIGRATALMFKRRVCKVPARALKGT